MACGQWLEAGAQIRPKKRIVIILKTILWFVVCPSRQSKLIDRLYKANLVVKSGPYGGLNKCKLYLKIAVVKHFYKTIHFTVKMKSIFL